MELQTPGEGVTTKEPGTIVALSGTTMSVRNDKTGKTINYQFHGSAQSTPSGLGMNQPKDFRPWPQIETWQQWGEKKISEDGDMSVRPFRVGDQVGRQELIVRGFTRVSFQANVYIFAALVVLLGVAMGIGMAAVYKHIPTYFPEDVGTVGGLVGVIGGLGGFILPIIFGKLLSLTGIWTTCWMLLCPCAIACLIWMSVVVRRVLRQESPRIAAQFDWQSNVVSESAIVERLGQS